MVQEMEPKSKSHFRQRERLRTNACLPDSEKKSVIRGNSSGEHRKYFRKRIARKFVSTALKTNSPLTHQQDKGEFSNPIATITQNEIPIYMSNNPAIKEKARKTWERIKGQVFHNNQGLSCKVK